MGRRRATSHEYLGIYDIDFKDFKKIHKNDWPEDSIQDYTKRNIETQNWIIDNTPECKKHLRNITIDNLLNGK